MEAAKPNDFWDKAFDGLCEDDRSALTVTDSGNNHAKIAVDDVLAAALAKRDECLKKRWKIRIKGKTIVIRDVLDKLTTWIRKFMVCL